MAVIVALLLSIGALPGAQGRVTVAGGKVGGSLSVNVASVPSPATFPVPETSVRRPKPEMATTATTWRGTAGFRPNPCRTGPGFRADACPLANYRGDFTRPEIGALIDRAFPDDPTTWRQVASCESAPADHPDGQYRWAVGPLGERGLFQIHPVHARQGGLVEQLGYVWDDVYEVGPNIDMAARLRAEVGASAWVCWRHVRGNPGRYRL